VQSDPFTMSIRLVGHALGFVVLQPGTSGVCTTHCDL
jgi:hypothetical protein